jgi:hypothetical protein
MIETTTIYAQQLVDKHITLFKHHDANPRLNIGLYEYFKQSAIFTVDEMLKELKSIRINLSPGSYVSYKDYQRDLDGIQHDAISKLLFLDQVKKEIEKL